MARFDRYLLSQLMVLFGFFSLVLVSVYWVNRAVVLFDQLIANGQSAVVFLEFTALSLPKVISLVLPMSAIAAVIYVANRLASESELVIVQATGFSPYRLARPVLMFGIIVALMVSVLTHFLVPLSIGQLRTRTAEIAENATARLLQEGRFLHPAPGITFYIGEITPAGELKSVFLSDGRVKNQRTNYSASSALLIRDDGGTKLVMFDGVSQNLNVETKRLATTSFTDFSLNISSFVTTSKPTRRKVSQLSTRELLWPTKALQKETGASVGTMVQKGHNRISQALLSIVAALVGFSALLVGNYSRFGLWRQILVAIVLLILIKSVDNAMTDFVRRDPAMWMLSYLAVVIGFVVAIVLLWLSERPSFFVRRHRLGSP